jgi:hypothetical protein
LILSLLSIFGTLRAVLAGLFDFSGPVPDKLTKFAAMYISVRRLLGPPPGGDNDEQSR